MPNNRNDWLILYLEEKNQYYYLEGKTNSRQETKSNHTITKQFNNKCNTKRTVFRMKKKRGHFVIKLLEDATMLRELKNERIDINIKTNRTFFRNRHIDVKQQLILHWTYRNWLNTWVRKKECLHHFYKTRSSNKSNF